MAVYEYLKKENRDYDLLYKDFLSNGLEDREAKKVITSIKDTDKTGIAYTPEEVFRSLFSKKNRHEYQTV